MGSGLIRALIVDDTVSNGRLLEAKLVKARLHVDMAESGEDALRFLDRHDYCIVLLDVMMPDMDGYEVSRRIRAHPRASASPIIMITALDGAQARIDGLAAGADDFFVKPVEDEVLFSRIHDLIRARAPA